MAMKLSTAAPKLAPSDFRYLSAWVQGVDVREAWVRYQAHRGPADLRRIRTTTRTLMDLLAGVAKRHGLAEAAVLRRDAARIGAMASAPPMMSSSAPAMNSADVVVNSSAAAMTSGHPPPTLEAFREELQDPDFYSEAELAELWRERYGRLASRDPAAAPSRQIRLSAQERVHERRARLVRRQLDALRKLEALAAASPMPEDLVESWLFSSELARRLRSVGILRLAELMFFVRQHGYRWYRKVPRIGEEGAKRLVAWLRQHEASLGPVASTALAPRLQLGTAVTNPAPSMGVVPLERLVVPASKSGAEGKNRAPANTCTIGAANDYQAIQAWLALYTPASDPVTGEIRGSHHTWRAYRKEAERLLLWALFERRKALSDLDALDLAEYRRFLFAPGPLFVGSRTAPRWSEHWRPFEGPLAPRSRQAAETICKSMFSWLVQVGYLRRNPWAQLRGGRQAQPLQELRSLSDHQWSLVSSWLDALPLSAANRRLRLMFRLAFVTGMREAEMAGARVGWLHQDIDASGELAWTLHVTGKGHKQREVPLPARFVAELCEHLASKGLMDEPIVAHLAALREFRPELPLLSALEDPGKPMDGKRVYELVKRAFIACADSLEVSDPVAAARIRRASPHWLRHTHGRMWVEGGGDRGLLRDRLGHASIVTTGIYDRSDARRQRTVVERLFGV